MVKVDLITGFLGSGKTTFIRGYVQYLLKQNEKICILENDYGAINVDMLLLSDLKTDRLGIEMVAGGCDYDCHRRRFKTKLITMAMLGYTRVIIEPSGIFDVDEFFDLLHEDPLYSRYSIDNVLAIVDANLKDSLSDQANYMLASQVAQAGRIILSKTQYTSNDEILQTIAHINQELSNIQCIRRFHLHENVICKDWSTLTDEDYALISHSGFQETGFIKQFAIDGTTFQSLFFMNIQISNEEVMKNIEKIWEDPSIGTIMRIKGFLKDGMDWVEVNSTKEITKIDTISQGQEIVIVIGENLDENKIATYFPSEYSTIHTS